MLDEGITSQGAAHRTFDEHGKRMWTATAKKDMSLKDKTIASGRSGVGPKGVDSDTKRTDVGIK